MPRRIIKLTTMYVALILCMTAGWHTWIGIGLGVVIGLHTAGFRIVEDHFKLSDRDLKALLRG